MMATCEIKALQTMCGVVLQYSLLLKFFSWGLEFGHVFLTQNLTTLWQYWIYKCSRFSTDAKTSGMYIDPILDLIKDLVHRQGFGFAQNCFDRIPSCLNPIFLFRNSSPMRKKSGKSHSFLFCFRGMHLLHRIKPKKHTQCNCGHFTNRQWQIT